MSGGFQYNLTTQSQFQQMKQRNHQLMQQNYSLKKTLQEMIKVNNQLSDTIEQFNNSALENPDLIKNLQQQHHTHNTKNKNRVSDHSECQKMVENLEEQVEYFKNVAYQKVNNLDNPEIINALQGLIDSFKQTQKYYQDQITAISEEIDNYKNQWDSKIFKVQQMYFQRTRILQQTIKQLRKKQQIVSIIQKKFAQDSSRGPRRLMKKNSQIDTSSERKVNSHAQQIDTIKQKPEKNDNFSKQIQELKQRQKKLNDQLKEKDRTIGVYTELLSKLRKKLSEKY